MADDTRFDERPVRLAIDGAVAALTWVGCLALLWIVFGPSTAAEAEERELRIKILFGSRLKARSWEGQQSEIYAMCLALNRMTNLGMPQGEWVAAA